MWRKIIQQFNQGAFVITMPIVLFPFSVLAADKKNNIQTIGTNTDPGSTGYLAQLVVGLVIVLLCIVVLAWLAKRFNNFQSSTGGSLQILDGMSMGARERVVLVQVGSTQLLLGVAPGRVNILHVLEQPVEKTNELSGKSFGINLQEKFSTILSRQKQ